MGETMNDYRYDMKPHSSHRGNPAHRGNPGSSKNSKRQVRSSLISNYAREAQIPDKIATKLNPNARRQRPPKPENLLPEIDQVRDIGVSKGSEATPQELYAIGAVFDHLYRGGSPMGCINVFQKEVSRGPPKDFFSCVGHLGNCGLDGDEETLVTRTLTDDDDTLPTMDWTYNRSELGTDTSTLFDLYTLDEDGTYSRSFLSRSSTMQSSFDGNDRMSPSPTPPETIPEHEEASNRPWDEQTGVDTNGGTMSSTPQPPAPRRRLPGMRQVPTFKKLRNRKKSSSSDSGSVDTNLWSGVTGGTSPSRRDKSHRHSPTGSPNQSPNGSPVSTRRVIQPPRVRSILDGETYAGEELIYNDAPMDDTLERLKTWSAVLVEAAKEQAPIAMAAAGEAASSAAKAATAAAAAAGATRTPSRFRAHHPESNNHHHEEETNHNDNDPNVASSSLPAKASNATTDLTSLVHMLRDAVADNIPEETKASTRELQAAVVETFQSHAAAFQQYYDGDIDDDYYSSDEDITYGNRPPRKPLNSLARQMRNLATKEPTRTYAVSEQNQFVGRQPDESTSSTPTRNASSRRNNTKSSAESPAARGASDSSTVGAVVATTESVVLQTPQRKTELPTGDVASVSPGLTVESTTPSKQQPRLYGTEAASVSGIVSRADTEGLGSHRGDAASVHSSSVVKKVPSSVITTTFDGMVTTTTTVLQELTLTPSRVSSSSTPAGIPRPRQLFSKQRTHTEPNANSNPGLPKSSSMASSSRRSQLPPVPPTRNLSTTTPLLNLSTDDDGTELSIIGFASSENGTDLATVSTPPGGGSSPGISLKKRFSFRKRRTDASSSKASTAATGSPTGVADATIFETPVVANDDDEDALYYNNNNDDSLVAVVAGDHHKNEMVAAPLAADESNETTHGMLLLENNKEVSGCCEVESV